MFLLFNHEVFKILHFCENVDLAEFLNCESNVKTSFQVFQIQIAVLAIIYEEHG